MRTRSKNRGKMKDPSAKQPDVQVEGLTLQRLSARLNAKLEAASKDSHAPESTLQQRIPSKRKWDDISDGEVVEAGYRHVHEPVYSSWIPQDATKYARLDVCVSSYTRQSWVVELLSIEKEALDKVREKWALSDVEREQKKTAMLKSKFEVYLQVLLSNVLNSSFLIEVHEEDDEYFLENMEHVDGENGEHLRELLECHSLDGALVTACETFPQLVKADLKDPSTGGICDGCKEGGKSTEMRFGPEQYDELRLTLLVREDRTEHGGQTAFALCDTCARLVQLYSRLYHYRYFAFQACKKQVARRSESPRGRSSPITLVQNLGSNKWLVLESMPHDPVWASLENCLRDVSWLDQMFENLQSLWKECKHLTSLAFLLQGR
ncbi:uncharacterized protein LOC8052058 isoform X2 [Ixodes scapularis]|uniref:uncharacterized protein LOC8052058 isoform X2 n=1 Tax=Ixodes scapularis TaxID=6945 RepID=UPI001A9CDFCB|nr:uncharacterized protein LOC8052058 isoform X2 [Ixodes scapularis]